MSPNSAGAFVGRDAEIEQFELFIAEDSPHWVMMVDGLPGMGRRALIDWLRKNRCGAILSAKVEVAPGTTESDVMRLLVGQLDATLAVDFQAQLDHLAAEEGQQTLVHYAPSFDMRASFLGSIQEASQGNVTMPLGDLATVVQVDRRARRLDLLERVLSQLRDRVWVLFLAGAENLDEGPLQRFILRELVPRLRARFRGFRLYLSGQTVPSGAFARGEQVSITLGPFSAKETGDFLERAGLDKSESKAAYALTGGHPLLLSMYADGAAARKGGAVSAAAPLLDDSARTSWIYDGIISTLRSPSLRAIAPDLALLDWFDLSLLRAVFDAPITPDEFQSLVRRSMIKALPNGRWRCHDLIRPHLMTQRASLDPEGTRALQRRAFAAYRERIAGEEERAGAKWFDTRLGFVSAALQSASAFSSREAETFALSELVLGVLEFEESYVYALARALDAPGAAAAIKKIGQQTRELLEDITVQKWSDDANTLAGRLATSAQERGDAEGAVRLLHLSTRSSLKMRRTAEGLATAQRALALDDSLESRLLLAEAQGDAGKGDDALRTIAGARATFGDSATLRVSEGLLAFTLGNAEEAIRHFTEAIAADPAGALDARLWLGFLIQARGEHEQALAQADAILAVDPTHALAAMLRLDSLALLGRFSELQTQVQQMSSQFAHFLNVGTSMAATLADPIARGRLIAALKVDPAAVPPPLIFALCEVLGLEGDVKAVDEWTAIAEARFPETHELCEIKRAGALVFAQRPAEAAAKLSPLVAAGTDSWDAYFLLSVCHVMLKEGGEARALLARVSMFWPRLQDVVDDRFALSYVAENRGADALAYLTEQAASRELGPMARLVRARLLVGAGQIDDALDMLDYILHTDDRAALPLTSAIDARFMYGMLQLQRNRAETANAARTLEDWFKQPAGVRAASTLYTELLDEESLRRLLRDNSNGDARTRSAIVEGLAKCIIHRGPSQEDLFEALRTNPGRMELAVALSAPYLKANNTKDLVATMNRIEETAPGLLAAWNQLTFEVLASSAARETEQIRATTLQMGNSAVARIGFAKILGTLGKITVDMAHDEFVAVAAEHPDLADNCAALESTMLIELGLLDRAAAALAPYLQRDDTPEIMIDAITSLYLAQKDRASAIAFSRRIAERFPRRRRITQERVVDLLIAGDKHDEALAMLATMEQEAPLSSGLLVSKANALGGLDRFDDALAVLPGDDELSDLPADERGLIIRTRARWLRDAKRLDDSIAAYEAAKVATPRDPRVRFGLAKSLRAAERWGDAYEAILDGVALAPSELSSFESELRELRELRDKRG